MGDHNVPNPLSCECHNCLVEHAYPAHHDADTRNALQEREELSGLPWVRALSCQPGMEQVLTAGALLSSSCARPEDHIVRIAGSRRHYS